jgi:hypothetical protein
VIEWRGRTSTETCEAVREAGGFGFAAHPFSRGSNRFRRLGKGMPFDELDCDALHGIELWSFVTDTAERLATIPAVLRFIAVPHRAVDHPPPENVAEWDRLCAVRRTVAIGGLDAHQFGRRVGGRVPFRLMSYKRSFRYLHTHVLCEEQPSGDVEHDREQVYAALREGRCYLAMDSLSPARGFRFWADGAGGTLDMGAEAPAATFDLHASLPRPAKLRLLRNGEEVTSVEAPALAHRVDQPGVYRVEARLEAHRAERTWIMSNPIYLR